LFERNKVNATILRDNQANVKKYQIKVNFYPKAVIKHDFIVLFGL
jgi:hypothetical protein